MPDPGSDHLDWKYQPTARLTDPEGHDLIVRVVPRGAPHRGGPPNAIALVLVALFVAVRHRLFYRDDFCVVVLHRPPGWHNDRVVYEERVKRRDAARNRARTIAADLRTGEMRLAVSE